MGWVDRYIEPSSSPFYMLAFFMLIVGFTFFYVSITFNPTELADNMKKYGGFVPGIRPGRPTADYLRYVLSRLTAPGSVYLAWSRCSRWSRWPRSGSPTSSSSAASAC